MTQMLNIQLQLLELYHVHVLVLDHSRPTSICLGHSTVSGLHSVHAQHLTRQVA